MRPKNIDEWRTCYFSNVKTKEHIEESGRKLYVKITEVVRSEVEDVSEKDCIDYMVQLVIDRTFDGYINEIQTVYGQLEHELKVKIEAAPDELDRLYNVDFFIAVENKFIGLQIKPVSFIGGTIQLAELFKEKAIQEETHKRFTEKYGDNVFYVYTYKTGDKNEIYNKEVIAEIREEIARLSNK